MYLRKGIYIYKCHINCTMSQLSWSPEFNHVKLKHLRTNLRTLYKFLYVCRMYIEIIYTYIHIYTANKFEQERTQNCPKEINNEEKKNPNQ